MKETLKMNQSINRYRNHQLYVTKKDYAEQGAETHTHTNKYILFSLFLGQLRRFFTIMEIVEVRV